MAIYRTDDEERHARITAMIDRFHAAQQLRLVKRGLVLWGRTQAARQAQAYADPPPPEKVH